MKKRSAVEAGILEKFTRKVEPHGFSIKNDKIKSEHFIDYGYSVGEIQYQLSIIFLKPNFLKYENYLSIHSPRITELVKSLDAEFAEEEWKILRIRLNSYLHPKNADGFYNTNETVDKHIKENPETDQDFARLAVDLFETYFLPVINKIVPETNSLMKLDKLLSDIPEILNHSKPIRIRVHSTTLVQQILASIIVAKAVNRLNYGDLVNRYMAYAEKFEPGRIKEMDVMRKAITCYKSACHLLLNPFQFL